MTAAIAPRVVTAGATTHCLRCSSNSRVGFVPVSLTWAAAAASKRTRLPQRELTWSGSSTVRPRFKRHQKIAGGAWLRGDARSLPFRDASLDGVFDYQCLAAIPTAYWRTVVAEVRRVLRP